VQLELKPPATHVEFAFRKHIHMQRLIGNFLVMKMGELNQLTWEVNTLAM